MANIFTVQTIVDSTKRTLVKLTGKFDGSAQEGPNTKIFAANLYGALDTNGLIAAGNANSVYRSTYHLTVKRIQADVAGSGYVEIYWYGTGTGNTTIVTAGANHQSIYEWDEDSAVIPNNGPTANVTGDIGIATFGMGANNAYTIILDLRKNDSRFPVDYDMGQTRDPMAFNQGFRAPRGGTGIGAN